MKPIKISPSVLSSDFSRLGEETKMMDSCKADMLHLDVMDGNFVPNITFGAPVIKSIRNCTAMPFDVHLMINKPLRYIENFRDAGADIITFHVESGSPVAQTIERIRATGCAASLSVRPKTDIEEVFPYLDKLAMVLIMTVEPGFGGQSFITDTLGKISSLRAECLRRGLNLDIQVDGGINEQTIVDAAKAGANVFVAGSAVFNAKQPSQAINNLRRLAKDAFKWSV